MFNCSRRQMLRLLGGSGLGGWLFGPLVAEANQKGWPLIPGEAGWPTGEPGPKLPFPRLGKLAPRASKAIEASPLSVGFETLDRKMFDPERTYPHLARLGVKWARVQTGWCRCEPEKGRYEFGWLDAVVDRLLAIGIRPWFNLGYGNRVYTPEAKDVSAVGWAPIFTQEARTGWKRFVQALAKHFAQRVRHWEIWNEPNISTFWKPRKPNAKDYVELVRLTAPILREHVPNGVIVGGAFAGMPLQYLRQCLDAGLANYVDRISYHPYRPVPEKNYAQQLRQFRKLLAGYRPGIALWQGECGCPSYTSKFATGAMAKLPWTELRQAKWLLRRILSDLAEQVELTSYFHTVDLFGYNYGEGRTSLNNYKGLLRGTDYSPKLSYFAYQCLCALFDAHTHRAGELEILVEVPEESHSNSAIISDPSNSTLETLTKIAPKAEVPEIYTVAFQRGGWLLVAYWTAADLFGPWSARGVTLCVPAGQKLKLTNPVLVDPLRQQVYQMPLPPPQRGVYRLAHLPLADYPWIVTDRQAIPGIIEI